MTRIDQKLLFTALGFLVVILNDAPKEKQALRAAAIADLIESFCMGAVPEAFGKEEENPLLQQAFEALQAVMDEGLNYSTEQAAEHVLTRIKTRNE